MREYILKITGREEIRFRAESVESAIAIADREFERRRVRFHNSSYEVINDKGDSIYKCKFQAIRST